MPDRITVRCNEKTEASFYLWRTDEVVEEDHGCDSCGDLLKNGEVFCTEDVVNGPENSREYRCHDCAKDLILNVLAILPQMNYQQLRSER